LSTSNEIVVVGGSEAARDAVVAMCRGAGLEARSATSITVEAPISAPPLIVITGDEVASLVAAAREVPHLASVPVLAVVPAVPPGAAAEAIAAGATDVVNTPLNAAVVGARIRNLLRSRATGTAWSPAPALIRIVDSLGQQGDTPHALTAVLNVLREALGFERASLIAHLDGSDHAFVVAATDDPSHSRFVLRIADYPEVAEAIRSGQPLLIDDVQLSSLMEPVLPKLAGRAVRAIAVFPVQWRNRALGAILMRKPSLGASHVAGRGVEYARIVTTILAAHLRHGAVLESVREQTLAGRGTSSGLSRARFEAERRLRGIESLREHFDASDDGVVILDDQSRILFVNRAAERITGFGADGLIGSELADLVAPEHRSLITDVVAQVIAGGNHEPFDLELSTTTGAPTMVSVSTSTVLASTGAVTLTFRDVTAQRALETELRSTKEFLERLIDSTVDAIVAADLRGSVILFNQGAERIYGWRAEEVIGKLNVADLYPEGVARQIMRMLRSTSYGGVGRLEQTRREIRTKGGELVPVNMTASIVYEGDREVATVGIFSDLRDRIRIEQKLLQAQQKLQLTEKQALVAELAGAAAHELNQPLTSIIGYAQLVQRQSEPAARHLRGVGVILREAERMADIVKKIGRITKYETTPYVGSQSIIDLDRSSVHDSGVHDNPDRPAVELHTPTVPDTPPDPSSETGTTDWEKTREFSAAKLHPDVAAALGEIVDDPALDPDPLDPTPRRRRRPGDPDELGELRPSDRDLELGPRRGGGS
jgi:PAS domain S-box-containing protein